MTRSVASCPVCFEKRTKAFHFQCGHFFCASCAVKCATCPICYSLPISASSSSPIPPSLVDDRPAPPSPPRLLVASAASTARETRSAERGWEVVGGKSSTTSSSKQQPAASLTTSSSKQQHVVVAASSSRTSLSKQDPRVAASSSSSRAATTIDASKQKASASLTGAGRTVIAPSSSSTTAATLATNGWKEIKKTHQDAKKAPRPPAPPPIPSVSSSTPTSVWKRGDPLTSSSTTPSSDMRSYLAAVTTTPSSAAPSFRPAGTAAPVQRPPSKAAGAVQQPAKRKNKPSETLQVDLLAMAMQARKDQQDKKNKAATAAAKPLNHRALARNNNEQQSFNQATTAPTPKLRGKVMGAGEQARRKNRLSSLKKSILQERRARWWLIHPETKPFPLVSHPALMEHDCVWLEKDEFPILRVDQDEQGDDDEESDDGRRDAELVQNIDDATHVVDGDDDELGSTEDDDGDGDRDEDETGNTSEQIDGDEQAISTTSHDQHLPSSSSDSDEDEEKITTAVLKEDPCLSGTIEFDPTLASPVYFGASFKRRIAAALVPADPAPAASKPKPTKLKSLPLPRPVRDYVNQALSTDLDELLASMLGSLIKFQDRARSEDPIKAKLRRRLVMGLHEVRRGVRSRKCIAVIVAPNIEDATKLDENVQEILSMCTTAPPGQQEHVWEPIPIVFASSKRVLAKALGKRAAISSVGIYSADGAYEQFKQSLSLAKKLQEFWKSQVEDERRVALQDGKRIVCGGVCKRQLSDLVRRDCFKCRKSFCESCAASRQAKAVPCSAAAAASGGEDGSSPSPCTIVRVARTLPVLTVKTLSVEAVEFVPPSFMTTATTKLSIAAPAFVPGRAPVLVQPELIQAFKIPTTMSSLKVDL